MSVLQEDLLETDNTLLNSIDVTANFKTPLPKSQKTKSKSQKYSVLSLKKPPGDDNRIESQGFNEKKQSKSSNLPIKRPLEDTLDNIEDTQVLVGCSDTRNRLDTNNSTDSNCLESKKSKTSGPKIEFDAFQTYLNGEKENIKLSQLSSQFFQCSQVLNQLENAIIENDKKHSTMHSKSNTNQTSIIDRLESIFHESNRQEIEQFFDQVGHSISIMGADVENKNEYLSQVLDVLFNSQTEKSPNIPNQTITDDILTNTSINATFGTTLKRAFLENASKELTYSKIFDNSATLETTCAQNRVEFKELGPFYGLPIRVKELIKLYKGIEELYDWQDECLKLAAVKQRKNLIYALPTSGGKTLVAEILMLREVMGYRRNVLFILPFVAIVQEKVWTLSPFGVALDFLIEEYAASKGTYPPRKRRRKNSIYIATIEKALGLINSLIEAGRINELGLIIVDELHLVGEQGRGPTLEALLTKVMHIKADIQIVGMSATIGNVADLCRFLDAEIYTQNFRPVELIEYVKCGPEIAKIDWSKSEEDLLTVVRRVDFGYSDGVKAIDPDHLGGLVMEVIPKESCLIFCPTKKNCENVAYLLCRIANKNLKEYRKEEKNQIIFALKDETGSLCKIFNVSIQFGIAYHHSGLTNEERRIIEDAFRAGVISVICCTSTLAAGVNLPAKRVILRQPYVGREFISLSKYKQMVGRAGRAGLGETGDSIMICTPQDLPKVRNLLLAPMDEALSSMHVADGKGLRHLLLSCISLNLANTRPELQAVAKKTLLFIQNERLGVNIKQLTDRVISDLFKLGALQDSDLTQSQNTSFSNVTIKLDTSMSTPDLSLTLDPQPKKRKIVVKNDTVLQISKFGCAAIKGGFELTRAHLLYDDLHQAQGSLVLLNSLHLLYLVTPYDVAEQIRPNKVDYYNIYIKLAPNELQTAKVLGLNDSVALKMLSNQPIKSVSERVLNRFYLTLMLFDLWNEKSVFEVSEKYQINRGVVQNLMTSSATFASNVVNFCEGLEEFWTFAHLFKGMSQRLSSCCVRELLPLMELPAVKQNRAKQLFNAGYQSLQSIAKANTDDLMEKIEFMPRRVAKQLIAASKMLLLEKVENLREEAEDVLDGVENPNQTIE